MTPRERVLTALNHEEPDRVPLLGTFTPEAESKLKDHFGVNGYDLDRVVGNDVLMVSQGICDGYYASDEEEYQCEWGITWRRVGLYTEMVKHPLAGVSDLSGFHIPDPTLPERYDKARKLIETYGSDYAIMGVVVCTIFEACWYLRGLDQFMVDLVVNKDFVHELMDKVMQFPLEAGKRFIELGCDIIWTGDDVGSQRGMLISPETWREFLKPRYAKLWGEFKKLNPDIKIAYHSDGNIEPIIPELIEIGLDILNPVQPKCMDPAKIKRQYGDRLSVWGTLDTQETLPFGSPEDVAAEVKQRIETVGRGGGFILGPTHNIQADVSLENILAFYDAGKRYGRYPIGSGF